MKRIMKRKNFSIINQNAGIITRTRYSASPEIFNFIKKDEIKTFGQKWLEIGIFGIGIEKYFHKLKRRRWKITKHYNKNLSRNFQGA